MFKTFTLVLGFLVFALAGFFLGRWTLETEVAGNSLGSNNPLVSITPIDKSLSEIDGSHGQKPPLMQKQPSARLSYAADFSQMQLLLKLAESNPIAALEQAAELRGDLKTRAQTEILAIWASIDAAGAWQWLETNQPDNSQGLVSLLEVIGLHQPDQVIEIADKFAQNHPYMAKDIYHSVLTGMTQAGAYDSASMLLEYLDLPSAIKTELMTYLADRWAVYEPQQALQWVLSKPQNFDTDAMGRLGATWAETDPQGVTSFAAGLADDSRKVMLEQSFNQWLAIDTASATSWLAAERPSEDLDPLIGKLAITTALDKDHVPEALVWIGRISNTQERMAVLTTILSSIKQKDPVMASQYIETTSYLTAANRAQLRVDLALASSQ
jgi:hypothetical protein